MSKQLYRSFQVVLLLVLFLFLTGKVIANQLTWYINPRFVTLTYIGIIFLAILIYRLFMEVRRSLRHPEHDEHAHEHDHAPSSVNLLIMLIPLLVGILIPARPLGSAAVFAKGLRTSSPLVSSQSSNRLFETESEQRDILGWATLFDIEDDLDRFMGQQASVVGFVYFDEHLPEGQFFVSRITVSCCAADGFAVVMLVDWPNATTLNQDAWVRVSGPVDKTYFNKQPEAIPLIRAETVEIVPQPDQPYLFP